MSAASPAQAPGGVAAPPYPAAITIAGGGWRSVLARNGRIPLATPRVQIGRMEGNEVILTDPLVSRHHAVLRWAPGGYELEDLGSANGTYLDGLRVTGRVALTPGQTIRIGNTDLAFNILDVGSQPNALSEPPAPATPSGPQSAPAQTLVQPLPSAPRPQQGQGALYAAPLQPQGATRAGVGAMAPAPYPYPYPYYGIAAPRQENRFVRWLKNELRKRYWRVFLLGLAAYIAASLVLSFTQNLNFVPLVLLLASALVPIVFVIFCWERSAFVDMPLAVVGITFMSGAVLGLIIAGTLEPILIPTAVVQNGISVLAAILIGIIEESAKVISVLWFLRDRRLRSELDGLILGAAAGMGFAALETAGYGFTAFLESFLHAINQQGATQASVIAAAVAGMNVALVLRMLLAVFGHGVWTGIVCAVIWRERGSALFRLTPNVLIAFAIAVGLHALWDWSPLVRAISTTGDTTSLLVVTIFWYLLIGGIGLLFLRFLLRESLQRAKFGPLAPPPPPLLSAFFRDLFGLRLPAAPALAYGAYGGYPQGYQGPAAQPLQAPYAAPNAMQQPRPTPPGTPLWPAPQPNPPNPSNPNQPQAMQAQQGAVYCPRCNAQYPAGTQRCARCGGPLMPTR